MQCVCDENDGLPAVAKGTDDGVGKEGLSDVRVDCSRMNTEYVDCMREYIPAESGSSKMTTSASKYKARAMLT